MKLVTRAYLQIDANLLLHYANFNNMKRFPSGYRYTLQRKYQYVSKNEVSVVFTWC